MKWLIALVLIGCSKESSINKIHQSYCSYESQEKRALFTSECIKNANPMSDEEPEDMILGCVKAAESIYCFWGDQFEAKRHYDKRNETLQEEL